MNGITYRETIVAWDEPHRWTYRVDSTTVPMAKALVEEWTIEPRERHCIVRWTFAVDPGVFFTLTAPIAPHLMGRLFKRAMRKLERMLV